ncbi:MAG: ANTAR domain-containing protein [Mycobacteriaceae bacterium]|nr:ANTAR domain-containing protein [Mycobacteriaceae bacterium]
MPSPHFQPRKHPALFALLYRILERVRGDIPDAIGLTITVHGRRYGEGPTIVAAWGIGSDIISAQLSGLGGPLPDALRYEMPVLSLDLFDDERWPRLTSDALVARAPQEAEAWTQVRGAVSVPGLWEDDGNIVISCLLKQPATAATVSALINYERLVNAAFVTTAAEDAAGIEDMLTVLQSRGAIEQAKGAIMGCLGCDADQAWDVLRRASQDFNVKVRAFAVALLEHISGTPAEQPAFGTPIIPDQQTRHAAEMTWAALRSPPRPARAAK